MSDDTSTDETAVVVNCGTAGGEQTVPHTDEAVAAAVQQFDTLNTSADQQAAQQAADDEAAQEAQKAAAIQALADQKDQAQQLALVVQEAVQSGTVHPAITALAKLMGVVQ